MKDVAGQKKVKEVLNKHNFRFKKSLGQNFLTDKNILHKIVDLAQIDDEDVVLEVGPGAGALTQVLATKAYQVLAVELDQTLLPVLKDTLGDFTNVAIIQDDILKIDFSSLIAHYPTHRWKVVANLPYYITTPVIMRFLEEKAPVHSLVVMVQKEVAKRMVASSGGKDYGMLSISVQYHTEPKIVLNVPKTVFIPQPEVDSAVVRLEIRNKPPIEVEDEKAFFRLVKAAFGQRRKTLQNALAGGLGLGREKVESLLNEAGIDGNRRGETLNMDEFALLANGLVKGKFL